MEGKRVSPAELKRAWAAGVDRLAEEVAKVMNAARDGRIIADSEEGVRDAHAVFRQRVYEATVSLLQGKQEAFSPSAPRTAEQGAPEDDPPDGQRAGGDS